MDQAPQTIPLSAVPILLQILSTPGHKNRDDTLSLLCDLVGSAFGDEGDALGASIRNAGGLVTLSWLLAESDTGVQKQALFLLANLASDAVDPNSQLTKQVLQECGAAYRLLPCLDSSDGEVLTYACAAVQNLCHDPEWADMLIELDVVPRLEELIGHSEQMVAHYAAGTLKNLLAATASLAEEDPTGSVPTLQVSEAALAKVEERSRLASLESIKWTHAARIVQRCWKTLQRCVQPGPASPPSIPPAQLVARRLHRLHRPRAHPCAPSPTGVTGNARRQRPRRFELPTSCQPSPKRRRAQRQPQRRAQRQPRLLRPRETRLPRAQSQSMRQRRRLCRRPRGKARHTARTRPRPTRRLAPTPTTPTPRWRRRSRLRRASS